MTVEVGSKCTTPRLNKISSLPTIDVMVQFNDMVEILFASGAQYVHGPLSESKSH